MCDLNAALVSRNDVAEVAIGRRSRTRAPVDECLRAISLFLALDLTSL
jgi:hypothetical protein